MVVLQVSEFPCVKHLVVFTILFATILKAESCEFPTSDEADDEEYRKDDNEGHDMYSHFFARSFLIRSINSGLSSGSTSRNRRSSLSVVVFFFISLNNNLRNILRHSHQYRYSTYMVVR